MKFSQTTPIEKRFGADVTGNWYPGFSGSGALGPREFRQLTSKHTIKDANKSLQLADAAFADMGLTLRAHKTKGLRQSKHLFLITASDGSLWCCNVSDATLRPADVP